jgi:hypothetical protein
MTVPQATLGTKLISFKAGPEKIDTEIYFTLFSDCVMLVFTQTGKIGSLVELIDKDLCI